MKNNNNSVLIAVFLVILTAASRIFNAQLQIPNMVPIAAIGLFSGAVIKDKRMLAVLIPLLGQFLADVYFQLFTHIRGFYDLPGMLCNYGAIVCATVLGMTMRRPKPASTIGYLLGASTVFFLVSNFGFYMQGWNGYTLSGLGKTYIDAVPFYKLTLLADLAGGVLLFGGYFLLLRRLEKNAVKSKI